MHAIVRALRLFGRERGLWKYALKPLAWAGLAYLLVVVLTTGAGERVGEAVARALGASAVTGGLAGGLAGLVLTIVFGGAIYLGLVGFISGFGFDRLSVEVEERLFGAAEGRSPGFAAGLADGVARGLLAVVLGIVALCLSVTVVGPWLIASLLCLIDFTAPALMRRGVGLGRQLGVARRLPDALPFALIAGAIVLIPVVNVLTLPILVAAGTILAAEGRVRASSEI